MHRQKDLPPPNCEACHLASPGLSPDNERVFWLYSKVVKYISAGFGGVNLDNIIKAFQLYGVPEGEHTVMLEKIMHIHDEFNKQGEKDSGGEQDRDKTDS